MPQREPTDVTQTAQARSLLTTLRANSVSQWFALRLRSQCEFKVSNLLEIAGIESFLPTWSEQVKWSDRVKVTVRPLFTGYVFAKCEVSEISHILQLAGVVQILPTSIAPIAIPDAEIESLRIVLASDLPVVCHPHVVGSPVLITHGALAGVSGVVVRTKGETRLVVNLEILNRSVSVEMESADVEAQKAA